jgi:hypothetical protein
MYGSSNRNRSSSSASKNTSSSSSTHCDQDQEKQSSVQKEELNSVSLRKPNDSISQTGGSSFARTENDLSKEDDCSISNSDVDDDNNTDDEYDEQELLMEFKKLISKHMKL